MFCEFFFSLYFTLVFIISEKWHVVNQFVKKLEFKSLINSNRERPIRKYRKILISQDQQYKELLKNMKFVEIMTMKF